MKPDAELTFLLADGRIDVAAAEQEAHRLRSAALREAVVALKHWIAARFGHGFGKAAPALVARKIRA